MKYQMGLINPNNPRLSPMTTIEPIELHWLAVIPNEPCNHNRPSDSKIVLKYS